MLKSHIKNMLLYGGIDRADFDAIRPMVWRRNLDSLRITAWLAAGLGATILVLNHFLRSGTQAPYLILLGGSALTLCLLPLLRGKSEPREVWSLLLCYGQMILICGYAIFLSTQAANYDTPATSAIVFIALLPLSIDDRPARMFAVMLGESILYLLFSHMMKSPHAFSLDAMNVATFCMVGMILYAVVCTRNLRELWQSERIQKMTTEIFKLLDCRGTVRIDFILDEHDMLFVNEPNTIPGSLAFYLWKECGVDFAKLAEIMVEDALRAHADKNSNVYAFDSTILQKVVAGTKGAKR